MDTAQLDLQSLAVASANNQVTSDACRHASDQLQPASRVTRTLPGAAGFLRQCYCSELRHCFFQCTRCVVNNADCRLGTVADGMLA